MEEKLGINTDNITLRKKKSLRQRKLIDYAWAYFMIFPTMVGLIILNIWPIFNTLYLSLTKWEGFGGTVWVGFENYKEMLTDESVRQALWNTFGYTIGVVPIGIFLSLIVAVLLNSNIKGKSLYRTIYFLPIVSTPAAIAMVWKWLFNSEFGLINYFLSFFGIEGPQWLTDSRFVLLSVIIVGIWSTLGYNMIILLSGLQEIPKTYYEAADIDGVGPISKFFVITIPLVSPTLFFVVVLSLISALQVFDHIYMMIDKTNAAIEHAQSLTYLFYKYAFMMNSKGYASAIVMLLFVIILIVTVIQLRLQKKWVYYQ